MSQDAFCDLPLALPESSYTRHSHGLDQFFQAIRGRPGLDILDLGEVNQSNVSFITDLGHRLYSHDFLRALEEGCQDGDRMSGPSEPEHIRRLLAETLDFAPRQFDGILVWDALQCLSRPLLAAMVSRLFEILRPQASLLALFDAGEKPEEVPVYSYRVSAADSMLLVPKGVRRPAQLFTNRGIEKLFHQFHAVKFFLTRDHLREIIVRR